MKTIPNNKQTPNFHSEADRKNYEGAMKYIAQSKTSKIDWKEEAERQRRNAKDL